MDPFDFDPLRRILEQVNSINSVSRIHEDLRRLEDANSRLLAELAVPRSIRTAFEQISDQARLQENIESARLPSVAFEYLRNYGETFGRVEFLEEISRKVNTVVDDWSASQRSVFDEINRLHRDMAALGIAFPAQETEKRSASRPRKRHIPKMPQNARRLLWEIILVLIPYLLSEHAAQQTEARLTTEVRAVSQGVTSLSDRIRALEGVASKAFDELRRIEAIRVHLEVRDRQATIREKPQSGSRMVARVPPGAYVLLIDTRGKWIEVEYRDEKTGAQASGWTLKKYFRRVTRAGEEKD
jgi:hypothetical protein